MSHDALVASLLGCAPTVTGSCYPPGLACSINTQVVNIVARKIGGLSRSARIETLRHVAGTFSIQKLNVRHCAEFPDACLRASGSSINARLRAELRQFSGAPALDT